MSDAAAGAGGEAEEEAVAGGRWAAQFSIHGPRGGRGASERALQSRADRGTAFGRLDVPGEGDEVAPVAVGLEQLRRGVDVGAREGGGEGGEPALGGRGHAGILGSKNQVRRGFPGELYAKAGVR